MSTAIKIIIGVVIVIAIVFVIKVICIALKLLWMLLPLAILIGIMYFFYRQTQKATKK